LPEPTRWLQRWFVGYAPGYMRKRFAALRLARDGLAPALPDTPALVLLNHPSWWDPMVCAILVGRYYRDRDSFAPIADAGLQRYPFLARLGFFGIEPHSVRGAAKFLRIAQAVLARPRGTLWITPQGHFADVRAPIVLEAGVGHLAARLHQGVIVPLALDYAFWNESYPEAFVRFGPLIDLADPQRPDNPADWTALIQQAMQANQDRLTEHVVSRDPARFVALFDGTTGVGGVYDLWRRVKAIFTGQHFDPSHDRRAGRAGDAS
jgi:1-acyl-sn-glycerol-3-phosphate acyltransferase